MAIKNTVLGGVDYTDGELLNAVNWNDTFNATSNLKWFNKVAPTGAYMIVFDSAKWQTTTHDSIDEGVTWAANGGKAIKPIRAVCRANSDYAFTIDGAGANPVFTINKGVAWNAPAVAPANLNAVYDIDYPDTDKVVITGNAIGGTNVGIWFSNDAGNNWTQATTGPNDGVGNDTAYSVSMYDDTTGFCLGLSVAIYDVYQTIDGGVNWTSILANVNNGTAYFVKAFSATEFVYTKTEVGQVVYGGWDNTVGGGSQVLLLAGTLNSTHLNAYSNLLELTNGSIYQKFGESTWDGVGFRKIGEFYVKTTNDGAMGSWNTSLLKPDAFRQTGIGFMYSKYLWDGGSNKIVDSFGDILQEV